MADERFFKSGISKSENQSRIVETLASHPDRAADYQRYDQEVWKKFANETIDLFVQLLQKLVHVRVFPEREKDTVRLSYASPEKVIEDFKIANQFFLECMKATNMNDLLLAAGKLSYYMEVILPIKLGTSATIEWMVRGFAKKLGYELGAFNISEGLGWDFKALTSVDMNDYAKWYQKNAFQNIVEIKNTPSESRKKNIPPV